MSEFQSTEPNHSVTDFSTPSHVESKLNNSQSQSKSTRALEKRVKLLEQELQAQIDSQTEQLAEKTSIIASQQLQITKLSQLTGVISCENCTILQQKISSQLLLISEFKEKFPQIIAFMKQMDSTCFDIVEGEQYKENHVYNELQGQIQGLKGEILKQNDEKFELEEKVREVLKEKEAVEALIKEQEIKVDEVDEKVEESQVIVSKVLELQQLVEKYELEAHEWRIKYELLTK